MLSDKAREAIGLTTEKIEFGDIHRTVTVNARVELPWHAQAMITSLVPGKIDRRAGPAGRNGSTWAGTCSRGQHRVGDSLQLDLIARPKRRSTWPASWSTNRRRSTAGRDRRQDAAGISRQSWQKRRQLFRSPGRSCRLSASTAALERSSSGASCSLRPDCQPGGRRHYARRRPHRANGEPYGPPVPRGRSHDALDCRRSVGV
jgi:hypothetical protein